MERISSVFSVPALQKTNRHPTRAKLVTLDALLSISDPPGQNHVKGGYHAALTNTVITEYWCKKGFSQVPIPDQAFKMCYIKSEAALGSTRKWANPPVCKNPLMPVTHYSNKNNSKVPGEMLRKFGLTRTSFSSGYSHNAKNSNSEHTGKDSESVHSKSVIMKFILYYQLYK